MDAGRIATASLLKIASPVSLITMVQKIIVSLCFVGGLAQAQTIDEFALVDRVADHQSEVTLVPVAALDGFLAIWSDERLPPFIDLYGNVLIPDGDALGEFVIADQEEDQSVPTAALDPDSGFAFVVFSDTRAYPFDIYGQWLAVGDSVVPAITATDTNQEVRAADGVQASPAVGFGGGRFVVVLEDRSSETTIDFICDEDEGSCGDIHALGFDPGAASAAWLASVSVAAGFQRDPAIVFDEAADAFVVVWSDERDELQADLYAQQITADGVRVGDEVPVSLAAGDQLLPAITHLTGGGSLVVWQDGRSDTNDIYGQRLDSSGALLETEIAIAVAEGEQLRPAIATCEEDGRILVAFEDYRATVISAAWAQALEADATAYGVNFALISVAGQQDIAISCDDSVFALAWTDWRNVDDTGEDGIPGTDDDPVSDLYGAFVTIDEPPNNPPLPPENIEPQSGAIDVSVTPTLAASPLVDLDGDSHLSSRWEVCDDETCDTQVYDSGQSKDLESHLVPNDKLTPDTLYFWRVRYTDSADRTSPPSTPTAFTTVANRAPETPENLEPKDGAEQVRLTPTLQASAFVDADKDPFAQSLWQLCEDIDCKTLIGEFTGSSNELRIDVGHLAPETTYSWRVRYDDARGATSDFSSTTRFSTGADTIPDTPTNISPPDGAQALLFPLTLQASTFSDADLDLHAASEWHVCIDSDCAYTVFESNTLTDSLTELTFAKGALLEGAEQYWRVRYQDDTGSFSEWSATTSFTTAPGTPTQPDGCGCMVGGRARQDFDVFRLFCVLGLLASLRAARVPHRAASKRTL